MRGESSERGERGVSKDVDKDEENVDGELVEYIKQAINQLCAGKFENDKDKQLFVKNVFGELRGKEADVFPTRSGSKLVEKLIAAGNLDFLSAFCASILKNPDVIFKVMCYNPKGSFMTQTLLEVIGKFLALDTKEKKDTISQNEDDETEETKNPIKEIGKLVVSLGKFLLENFDIAVKDNAASHVFRSLFALLSGVPLPDKLQGNNSAKHPSGKNTKKLTGEASTAEFLKSKTKLSKKFGILIKKFTLAVLKLDPLEDYICNPRSSILLQYLMHIHAKTESKLLDNFLTTMLPTIMLESVMYNQCGSRMMEMLFSVSPSDKLAEIWDQHLQENFLEIALHPIANYVAQKFIVKIPTEEILKDVFTTLEPHFHTLFIKGYFGFFMALCESCAKFSCHQEDIVQVLMKLYDCKSDKDFVCMLLYGKPYEQFQNSKSHTTKVCYHGSVIIQHIFRFQKPSQLQAIRGLVALPIVDIVNIAMDQFGNFAVDAFFKSASVSGKDKSKLLTEFKGKYVEIACNKLGSRVLETMWAIATLKEKEVIMGDLSQKRAKLTSTYCGSVIAKKFAVKTYLEHPISWKQGFEQKAKVIELFEPIVNPGVKESKVADAKDSKKRPASSEIPKSVKKKKTSVKNK